MVNRLLLGAMFIAVLVVGGCGGSNSPVVPLGADGQPDAVLETGRVAYERRCAVCHGGSGQGGRGKKLSDGEVFELHPEIDSLIAAIAEGRGNGMPAFAGTLDDAEIEAVARYVREVLN